VLRKMGDESLSHVDLTDHDFSGYLTKQSMWMKQWRRRYFVLKGNKFYFSKGPDTPPHGVIDLKDCLTVKSAENQSRPHCFQISTPNCTYYLCADSEADKDKFVGAIGRSIVRYSSAYTNEDGYED